MEVFVNIVDHKNGLYGRFLLYGVFRTIEKGYLFATIAGLVCFEIEKESANKTFECPGAFKTKLFDKTTTLSDISVNKMKKFEEIKQ
jgi:hydroxyethylthiazole kinase-like sugar kinase family protein